MPVQFEKAKINVWMIIGFVGVMLTNAFGLGVSYTKTTNRLDTIETAQKSGKAHVERVENDLRTVETRIQRFDIIDMQQQRAMEMITQNAAAIAATNNQLTKFTEGQNSKLDIISEKMSTLTTEVKVIQSQMEDRKMTTRKFGSSPDLSPLIK
jgi:chromosome segregation ATPase